MPPPPCRRCTSFVRSALLAFGALAILAATGPAAHAQAQEGGLLVRPPAHARIGYERVEFPGGEHVGLLGTTYLVDVPAVPGLSVGPAVYGAITGHRGGFFTVGGEAAWRHQIAGPLGIELGLYAGGGGGAGAPQGGGLMVRPHADVLWQLGPVALGVSLSRVRFPNGQIDGTQVGVVLNTISDFRYVPASRLDTPVASGGRAGLGFDRIQLVAGLYHLRSNTLLADGGIAPGDVGTLGVRAEQAFDANWYWGVEAAGATQRTVAGYAEYLGTLGYEAEVVRGHLNAGARIALGMGGGGGLRTGGGFLAKASVYGIVRLTNDLGLALEAGYVDAPSGEFRAALASASLVWSLDGPDPAGGAARPARTSFGSGVERFRAVRRDGSERPLNAIVLRVDRYLGRNLYVTGQVHSAVSGEAGGYSAALLGAGWRQPLNSSVAVGAELLAGASGGGGVDSHGAIVQPMGYLGWQLSPAVSLRLAAGHVKGIRGPLSSPIVEGALVVTYGVSSGS